MDNSNFRKMWKQIGLLVVVFLTLGQAMEFGRPDNIDRTADELELKNKIQTIFTEWKSARQNAWADDEILKYPKDAMDFAGSRFDEFGRFAIFSLDKYRGANLDGDDKYRDLLEATIIRMTVAAQNEMDRVVSVILKDAKSMLQDCESNRRRFIVEQHSVFHTVKQSLFYIPYSYHWVGVPMDNVLQKIKVFEKSLGSNIKPWMRKKLDTMYETIEKKKIEDSRSPTEKKIFKIISDDNAVPLRELTEPVPLSEPTNPTHRTETTTVWLVFNEIWFPLCFLLGMIIGTILMAKFYFKKEE
eukprot:69821_1